MINKLFTVEKPLTIKPYTFQRGVKGRIVDAAGRTLEFFVSEFVSVTLTWPGPGTSIPRGYISVQD